MNIKFAWLFLFILVFALVSRAQNRQDQSRWFIQQLEQEQFDSCVIAFDTILSNKVSAETLSKIWNSFPRYFGDFKGVSELKSEWKDTLEKITLLCNFEKVKVNLNLVYAPSNKIVGITFVPAGSTAAYKLPEYARLSAYSERKIMLKSGKHNLPGVLCLPNQVVNPPVAILLSGSGPNDKDESIGPNKILKDIAVGLASKGVASLRYDKRTLVYGEEWKAEKKQGIYEEVVEDALNAVKLVHSIPETRKSKIVVIGHSLGGMCSPWVASESSKIKAIILMAANARPLEDLIAEQFEYLFQLDSLDAEEKQNLADLSRQIQKVKDPMLLKQSPSDSLPLGLTSYYWQSLKAYNQVATAKKLKQPVLVLQGKRDYQVLMKDYEIWKKELQSFEKNKFIVYDNLNHLFISGEGKSKPEEYLKQGNVNEQVISEISAWIKSIED